MSLMVSLIKICQVNRSLEEVKAFCQNTLIETLNISFEEITKDRIVARMPVTAKVHQPIGLLHGGATLALAESIGSLGSHLLVEKDNKAAVGLEINANHIKSTRDGEVVGTGTLIHRGRTTHVWEIRIETSEGKLISICRMTNMIVDLPNG